MNTEKSNKDNTERRNIPILFCRFEDANGQRFSCTVPFNNDNVIASHIETLSEWYSTIDHNVAICGSQSEIMSVCSWYDNYAFYLSADDYYTILREKKTQVPQDSTVWVVCAEKFGSEYHYHTEQINCHETFADFMAKVTTEHAYICETAEVAVELVTRLSTL